MFVQKKSRLNTIASRQAVAALLCVSALSLNACSFPWSKDPVEDFIQALNDADATTAAKHSSDPGATAEALQQLRDNIGDTKLHVSLLPGGENRTETTWTVPSGEELKTTGTAERDPDSGLVKWSPALLDEAAPADATFLYSTDRRVETPVVDRSGNKLLSWTPVTVISAGPAQLGQATQIAHAVSEVLPDVTPQWIEERINAAGGESTALFSLRDQDMATVRARLQSIEGLSMREEGRLLSNSRELSTPLDQGLSDYWMEALDKGAGWSLRAVSEQGEEILGSAAPEHIVRITTTLDLPMQAAAQRAVDAESKPAAFVAIGSGGDILAVAQNAAASEQGSIALTGLFPPGSTFKTVTTAGALTSGTVGPDDIVDCPGTAEIDGRIIPNDNNFDLGKVPMHTAFAQSCNTTQGFISQSFAPETMRDTALSLGLGVDFDSPGLTTVTGSVPLTSPGAARVEAAIGQGEVLSSPFGLALMEASLANNGTMALPRLITSVDGPGGFEVGAVKADLQPAPLPEHTVESLRSMMKETVTTGSAKTLSDIPDLGGKTGTAETGSGGAHGWFTGIAGDVGFASFVENGDSSAPAIAIAGTWLRDDWRWK